MFAMYVDTNIWYIFIVINDIVMYLDSVKKVRKCPLYVYLTNSTYGSFYFKRDSKANQYLINPVRKVSITIIPSDVG